MLKRSKKIRGFSLIELLIVLSILLLLVTLVIQAFFRFRDASLLNSATDNLTSLLEEAHNATLSSRNDSVYGVHVEATKVVLFVGSIYSSGASTNKVFPFDTRLSAATTVVGGNVVFIRQTGATNNTGTTTISLISDATKKRTIYVGPAGVIERQ